MSDLKATAGNWKKSNTQDYAEILSDQGVVIAMVASAEDANLIAAAPKMYKFLDDLANGRGTDYPIEQLLMEARGEQQ